MQFAVAVGPLADGEQAAGADPGAGTLAQGGHALAGLAGDLAHLRQPAVGGVAEQVVHLSLTGAGIGGQGFGQALGQAADHPPPFAAQLLAVGEQIGGLDRGGEFLLELALGLRGLEGVGLGLQVGQGGQAAGHGAGRHGLMGAGLADHLSRFRWRISSALWQ